MDKDTFAILNFLRENPRSTKQSIASTCHISLSATERALDDLQTEKLISSAYEITAVGFKSLAHYKVDNAIIMAAGMSSRFAPISYERPKGILTVRGEILIERQIEQLKAAGIDNITVVVGYKKEEFFYLEEKYGVSIVVNSEYARRNNNSTIAAVASRLGNTYICSSDDYFAENPFERYVYDSYYSSVYIAGETDEYCITSDEMSGMITSVVAGGKDAWVMLGHAYWNKSFSRSFLRILTEEYDAPGTASKLWEDIYIDHIDELPMRERRYAAGIIYEFDTLDEAAAFDLDFIENVDSEVLTNICGVLNCPRAALHDFVPVSQGLTNLSVRFAVDGLQYIYRHPGVGTDKIISRQAEAYAQSIAEKLGIDRTYIYEDPYQGWKISRYIEGCIPFNYHNAENVEAAMALIRRLHSSMESSPWAFDVYDKAIGIVALLKEPQFKDFDELRGLAEKVHEFVAGDGVEPVLCHNDFYEPNLLVHDGEIDLIDWEYSAMSDYASDLGTFICCSDYGISEAERAISAYFARTPSAAELRHCMGYICLSSFYWFVWALYKDETGDPVGEWLYLWYRMTKQFGRHSLALYTNTD